eukprot:111898_1
MSASEHEVARHQKKEAYNHELVTSEDFYVAEIEALITHLMTPLSGSATRCNIKPGEIEFVFGIMQHILQFHLQFLRIIRDELTVVHTFAHYIGFIAMYSDYFKKYSLIIDMVASWSHSMEFREFIVLRLQNEKCAKYIDSRLCSLPWYLYRPLLRIKEYYRFFKDLLIITNPTDDEYKPLLKCKKGIRSLCHKIQRTDLHHIKKTRLLEIQLQIFGNTEPIVTNNRYFVYNRMCQVKVTGISSKKYKHIHLYIFNDGLLWCSKRGQFKKWFGFINTNLVYGVPDSSTSNDATLFIQYGSMHQRRKRRKKRNKAHMTRVSHAHSHSRSISISSKLEDVEENEEIKLNSHQDIIDQMAANHAPPTKKNVLLFVNEAARNQCLDKIKQTQSKYHKKLQHQARKRQYMSSKSKEKLKYLVVSGDGDDDSQSTYSRTEVSESSFIDLHLNFNHKPLESHKYNASMSTPTASQTGTTIHDPEHSDDTDTASEHSTSYISSNHSNHSQKQSESRPTISNHIVPNARPLNPLKQSVSTKITTIEEEDEEDELKTEPN